MIDHVEAMRRTDLVEEEVAVLDGPMPVESP
jgi:hypothetical protein